MEPVFTGWGMKVGALIGACEVVVVWGGGGGGGGGFEESRNSPKYKALLTSNLILSSLGQPNTEKL